MSLPEIVALVCWLIFLAYWFINWQNVKPTKDAKIETQNFRIIGVFIIAFLLLNHFIFNNALQLPTCNFDIAGCRYHNLSVNSPVMIVGIMGMFAAIVGLLIAIVARKTLAGNWSATIDLKEGHQLIRTGIYSHIRHPIYTGVLLMLLGNVLVFQTILTGVIFILLIIAFLMRIKNEESLMLKTFPKEYPEYMKHSKRLIPGIF